MEWTPARIRLLRENAGVRAKRTIGNAERGTHSPGLALRRALDQAFHPMSDIQHGRFLRGDPWCCAGDHLGEMVGIPAADDRG